MKRIFVRGQSRSGGTLMVTILDAHPDVAMGYELYEHLLEPLAAWRDQQPTRWSLFGRRRIRAHEVVEVVTARAARGGVDAATLDRLAAEHVAKGGDFRTLPDRMRFVETLVLFKMHKEGKKHWGSKAEAKYHEIIEAFPAGDTYFLFMQRDGRDVAASQKKVGSFNKTPKEIARSWRKNVEQFRKFADQPGVNARSVHYETLTNEPEKTLRDITDFLGIPWSDNLLRHYQMDLTLYRTPTGHLSAQQVNKAINTNSIGRWKQDLTREEIRDFEAEAGGMLKELGYA